MSATKMNKLIKKEEKCNTVWTIVGIILAVAAVAGIAFAIYKFFTAKNMEEFEQLSNNCKKTIKRNIKKLVDCDNKVVQVCKDKKTRNLCYIFSWQRRSWDDG